MVRGAHDLIKAAAVTYTSGDEGIWISALCAVANIRTAHKRTTVTPEGDIVFWETGGANEIKFTNDLQLRAAGDLTISTTLSIVGTGTTPPGI